MIIAALAFAALAAVLHVYIFVMESFTWTSPKTRAVFGIATQQQAEATKEMAFNQGFYNLFLAIMIGAGIVAFTLDETPIGATLVFAGAGSMLAAGTVLLVSSPDKASAAVKQLSAPLVAVVLLAIGLAL